MSAITPANIALRVPPLSLWKRMRVFSRMPFLSSAATTRPISSSRHVIMRGVGAAGRVFDVLVAVDVLLRRLIGRVRRVEGQVQVERLGGVVLFDELDRVLAQQRRRVAFFATGSLSRNQSSTPCSSCVK
jgi:hypothetical protein